MATVAISMITYNHAAFIEKAILGVIKQKSKHKYKLYITNDCSTDDTDLICQEYSQKYSDKIDYRILDQNIGLKNNFAFNLELCKNSGADYISICEGDDFWIDELKIEKQVTYLEGNKSISMCFHNALLLTGKEEIPKKQFSLLESRFYSKNEIFKNFIVPTASVIYRSDAIDNYSFIRDERILFPDILLWLKLSEKGSLLALSESMSVYRIHDKGATQVVFNENLYYRYKSHYGYLNEYYKGELSSDLRQKQFDIEISYLYYCLKFGSSKFSILKIIKIFSKYPLQSFQRLFRYFIKKLF